jgi:hypothetical protein
MIISTYFKNAMPGSAAIASSAITALTVVGVGTAILATETTYKVTGVAIATFALIAFKRLLEFVRDYNKPNPVEHQVQNHNIFWGARRLAWCVFSKPSRAG